MSKELVFIGFIIILAAIASLAKSIGASFTVTVEAVAYSALFVAIAAGLIYTNVIDEMSVIASGLLVFLWPTWWAALDSIANNAANKDELANLMFKNINWYNTPTFLYCVEAALVALFAWRLLSNRGLGGYRY